MKYYEALKKLFMEKKYSLPVFDLDDKITFKTNRERLLNSKIECFDIRSK